jgi:hypothetical protein
MTGADTTSRSRMIASFWPTRREVTSANVDVPDFVRSKLISHPAGVPC